MVLLPGTTSGWVSREMKWLLMMKVHLAPLVMNILFEMVFALIGEHGLDIFFAEFSVTCRHTPHQTVSAILAASSSHIASLAEFVVFITFVAT